MSILSASSTKLYEKENLIRESPVLWPFCDIGVSPYCFFLGKMSNHASTMGRAVRGGKNFG